MVPRRFVGSMIAALALAVAGAAHAGDGVVTLDLTRQTATSDTETLAPLAPAFKGGQAALWVRGATFDPQDFTLKVTGLTPGDYDIYGNGKRLAAKGSSELESGISFSLEGSLTHPDVMRCLEKSKATIDAGYASFSKSQAPEGMRVAGTLRQAKVWVQSGIRADESARSVDIIIAPAGNALERFDAHHRYTAQKAAEGNSRIVWLLQSARDRMYDVIGDSDLRNRAVAALTPVDLEAALSAAEGRLRIEAEVTNNCNIPIDGDISVAIPKGWKLAGKLPAFKQLGSGKTFRATIDLVPAAAEAAAPTSVPVAANLTVSQDDYTAKLKLRSSARQGH